MFTDKVKRIKNVAKVRLFEFMMEHKARTPFGKMIKKEVMKKLRSKR